MSRAIEAGQFNEEHVISHMVSEGGPAQPSFREIQYDRYIEALARTHPDIAAIFRAYGPDDDLTKNPLTAIGQQLASEYPSRSSRQVISTQPTQP